MAIRPELDRRIRELGRGLSDEDLEQALLTLASRRASTARNMLVHLAAEWPARESELLDAAASLAARHHALDGDESRLRSWLTLLTLRSDLARELGRRATARPRRGRANGVVAGPGPGRGNPHDLA